MHRGKRFLQNEVCSVLESLLRARPVHYRKSYRLGIALGLTHRFQQIKAPLQVVAVDDDRIKLALGQ